MPQDFVKAALAGELAPGQKKLVYVGGQRVLLVNVAGRYYAVAEVCPHAHAGLSKGQVYGDEVVCPVRGSAFNVKTGAVLSPPAAEGLTIYPVRTEGEDILVGPPGA